MSRLIRRIFDRSSKAPSRRVRSTRPIRTVADLKTRLLLQPLEDRTVPTVFTVNALADTGIGSGTTGDLRYCITQSNLNAGPNSIDATGVSGTITLTSALPSITQGVTITGPGPGDLTVDANFVGRVFNISTTSTFEMDDLTITDGSTGSPGGGIYGTSGANIVVKDSVITGCGSGGNGGGIYFFSGGSLDVENTSVINNTSNGSNGGGGIYFYGTASSYTISNSTIANNTAQHGGGLSFTNFSGTGNVTNSTITGNFASSASTGNTNGGGGIVRRSGSGSINLDNSIVSGNRLGRR